MAKQLNILALTRNPHSASFQQRVLNYIPLLAERGIRVEWAGIPRETFASPKKVLARMKDFDALWLHRYLVRPWSMGQWRQAADKIVFDFDDPIIHSSHGPSLMRRIKFSWLLKRCDAAMAASHHLAAYAQPYCSNVKVVPMAVEIPTAPLPPRRTNGRFELLWLGSRSTMKYLLHLQPVLERLGEVRKDVIV
jgi:hypothetical protein